MMKNADMTAKNADMPAMPIDGTHRGMTKREYFAAMAMQGLLASGVMKDDLSPTEEARYAALDATLCADALLAELERTP